MKRTSLGKLQEGDNSDQGTIAPDYGDPSVASPECPSGVSLSVIPVPNSTYRVNEASTFIVTASGCKYSYRLSYGNENKPFGFPTAVPGTVFSTTFPWTFTAPGSQTVSARISVLGQNQLPVREFPVSISVAVNQSLPLVCPESDVLIPRDASVNYPYAFNLQPNRPARVLSVTGTESDYIVASPTFSSTVSQTISGNITVKARNGGLRFQIKDANDVATTCSVSLRKDILGVTLDFNGDRILDDAALIRLADGNYQLQIAYTQQAGATKINTIIPAIGFLPSENYEWMIAGDMNGDSRPDLVFFRKEGSPAVGKFRVAFSRGGTVGGTDLAYDFVSLTGQWASDRLLSYPWLDVTSNPPRIIGSINGVSYASAIQNNTVANPEALVFLADMTASPNPVVSGNRTRLSLIVRGYGFCDVSYCAVNPSNECRTVETYIGGVNGNYRAATVSYNVGPLYSKIKIMSRCQLPDNSIQRRELLVPLLVSTVSRPACSLSVSRRNYSAVCDVTVSSTGGPVFTPQAPSFSGLTPSGSWNGAGTVWSGTGNCSTGADSIVSASVSGPGGNAACSPSPVTVPLVYRWVSTNGGQCGNVCSQAGMASVPYADGNYCASGEVRPAGASISYIHGTWGSGTQFRNAQSVNGYCYGASQKRDNDRTDITVACYCRR